jgi:uncharacterized protein
MRTYERNGIHVDQCTECRGLFLDRGELEHLVQAEGSFYGGGGGGGASEPRRQEEHRSHEHHGHDSYSHGGKHYKKRKKNFLEELFD